VHRRDHAHYAAYRVLGCVLLALVAGSLKGPDLITPLLPLRGNLMRLPSVLLVATALLYITLPSAILLWTEPDMDPDQEQIN
jgi:hypothetical protein